ncbi:MAG: hypothetical protein E6G39_13080 [Actinobacteria bacterium]|nr:MAG: hypothetical protein E6G39_13080 [Actinomycetota bacterium]
MRKSIATALAAATIAGGSLAVAAINPFGIASAQDSGTTPTAPAAPAPNGKFQSNEDPTHEAKETPAQEAAEDAGQRPSGGHFRGGDSNEDPAHEATESAEREAQEDAGGAATPTPTPSSGSTTGTSY